LTANIKQRQKSMTASFELLELLLYETVTFVCLERIAQRRKPSVLGQGVACQRSVMSYLLARLLRAKHALCLMGLRFALGSALC